MQALKSKVNPQELQKTLENMPAAWKPSDAPNPSTSVVLRGRWLAITDPWTAKRAAAIIGAVAKTGKIPTTLPVSWFPSCFDGLLNTPQTNGEGF